MDRRPHDEARLRATSNQWVAGIERPYLLVIHIPVYVDSAGRRWADELWHKDLVRHLEYIEHFVLACPHVYAEPPAGSLSLEGHSITYVELPRMGGRIRNVLTSPLVLFALWRAVAKAEIVHSAVGNWPPLTLGNLTFLAAWLQRKFLFINVESATWRLLPGERAGLLRRADAALSERANRLVVERADLSTFTQPEYRRTLLTRGSERGHVIAASWIDEANVLGVDQAKRLWEQKRRTGVVSFLFAARLSASKGVRELLAALDRLGEVPGQIRVDIMGQGELEAECRAYAASAAASGRQVRFVEPVAYGEPFMSVLRGYCGVLVPSLGDEQPRIVYDAYSQAVPVLASATPGLVSCVEHDVTGRHFQTGSAPELAAALQWGASHVAELEKMGLTALARAEASTHRQMHLRRLELLKQGLSARLRAGAVS